MSNSEWPMLLRTKKLMSKFSKIIIKQTIKLIEFKNRKNLTEYSQHYFAIEMTQTLAHNAHKTIGKTQKHLDLIVRIYNFKHIIQISIEFA